MIRLKLRWEARCPRHPRYRPHEQGAGAIKGGCRRCWRLYRVWEAWVALVNAIGEADRELAAWDPDNLFTICAPNSRKPKETQHDLRL